MTEQHDRFAHDDAAYVLGALSPDEAAAFEEHLATCMICQDNVGEISALPSMLAGITEADLVDADANSTPPDTLLPSLLRAARKQRNQRRWIATGVAGLAAAAIVALSIALISPGSSGTDSGPKPLAMTALVSSPVQATAAITDVDWGTRITLKCKYESVYDSDVSYNLVVHAKDGTTLSGGSWQLNPDKTTNFVGGTSLHRDQIASIDIAAGTMPILTLTL